MIDFKTIKVGDIVRVTGMGEPQKFYTYPGYIINGCPTCGHCLGAQVEPIEVKP